MRKHKAHRAGKITTAVLVAAITFMAGVLSTEWYFYPKLRVFTCAAISVKGDQNSGVTFDPTDPTELVLTHPLGIKCYVPHAGAVPQSQPQHYTPAPGQTIVNRMEF